MKSLAFVCIAIGLVLADACCSTKTNTPTPAPVPDVATEFCDKLNALGCKQLSNCPTIIREHMPDGGGFPVVWGFECVKAARDISQVTTCAGVGCLQ